jgi:hypothetical protein
MAKMVKELSFSMPNKAGQLGAVASVLRKARVNILEIAAWTEGKKAMFRIATNNNAKARQALRAAGIRAGEGQVLMVNLRNRVGALERVGKKLAKAGISLHCVVATTSGKTASVVLAGGNLKKAKRIL